MNFFTSVINVLFYLMIPLVLTILIELGAWKLLTIFFKDFKLKNMWVSIVAVNMATNPALNLSLSLIDPLRELILLEILFEVAVIFIEAGIFYLIYRSKSLNRNSFGRFGFGRFVLLSAFTNIVSYGVGLLLFRPTWL